MTAGSALGMFAASEICIARALFITWFVNTCGFIVCNSRHRLKPEARICTVPWIFQ